MSSPVLEFVQVQRRFGQGAGSVDALRDVTLALEPGQIVGVVGDNGAAGRRTRVTWRPAAAHASTAQPDPVAARFAFGFDASHMSRCAVNPLRRFTRCVLK